MTTCIRWAIFIYFTNKRERKQQNAFRTLDDMRMGQKMQSTECGSACLPISITHTKTKNKASLFPPFLWKEGRNSFMSSRLRTLFLVFVKAQNNTGAKEKKIYICLYLRFLVRIKREKGEKFFWHRMDKKIIFFSFFFPYQF